MLAAVVIMCSLHEPASCYPQMVYPTTCNGDLSPIENPVEIDSVIYVPTEMVWCDPHALTWVTLEDDQTLVLDAWGVITDRLERLTKIIKNRYLHRDDDKALMKEVRSHMAEISEYLDRIDAKIKW